MIDIPMALGSFKVALDIAKGMKDLNDATVRYGESIKPMEQILSAQEAQASLIQKIGDLEKEVTQLKDWSAEKQCYELKDIGQGCIAYTLKEGVQPPQPAHYLCANCFNQSKKRILQIEQRSVGRLQVYVCNDCRAELYFHGVRHAESNNARRR